MLLGPGADLKAQVLLSMEGSVMEDNRTQAEIDAIREAYSVKINAAIDAGNDRRAIELSSQFRDEAFITPFGKPARQDRSNAA
jgi:hypothetical protein